MFLFFSQIFLMLLMSFFDIQVQRMDSDEWKERCDAHEIVKDMVMKNDACAARLRAIASKHHSCEVRRRSRWIMDHYYGSAFPEGGTKKLPCLDMIPDKDERKAACKKYLKPVTEYGTRGYAPDYEPMRLATYEYIRDKMKNGGWTASQAKLHIKHMWIEEKCWTRENPYTHCYDYHLQLREDRP